MSIKCRIYIGRLGYEDGRCAASEEGGKGDDGGDHSQKLWQGAFYNKMIWFEHGRQHTEDGFIHLLDFSINFSMINDLLSVWNLFLGWNVCG